MPTSPRDLAGGTGWYQPTARLSNPRADVGIGPYASGKIVPCNQVRTNISGVPSTPGESGATLSKQERAGVSLIRHAFGVPPSPEGKVASGGGLPSTCYVAFWLFLQGILPQAVTQLWKGAVGKVSIHKNTPQLFYKLWSIFLDFPGSSGGEAGERVG